MNILQKYIQQFNFEEILMVLITKGIKLLILLTIFLLSKKIIDFLFKHTVGRSLSWTIQTPARQKTIERLLHNSMNYVLYFFLVYWLLSILGVPVSSLLAGAGLAGVANKSRGDMRAQIDIPVYISTDINKVMSIIEQVNQDNIEKYPEICGTPNVIGLITTPSGQLVFRVDIFTQNGQQTHIYSDFLKLYQEALIKEKIELPKFSGNSIAVK